ncbi:MAG: DUF11 domain-containing protein, partial [Gelidibacter sp.]|nr:DUF11 domain-containing protein [Gelidibacter sp.]
MTSQTTDLAIVVEAQNLSGNDLSQVHIYEEFQYLVTISNSGNSVFDASFTLQLDVEASIISFVSQNATNGATLIPINDFNLSGSNLLSAPIANLPNNSSLQIKITLKAPITVGGIAANAIVFAPDGTEDSNNSNNQSIISIDVTDLPIDFTVTHTQVAPPEGIGISAWNDIVTYQFTITNNSSIDYPLSAINGSLKLLSPYEYGQPIAQLISLSCLGGTNGMACFDTSNINSLPIVISSVQNTFTIGTVHVFTSGGSLTFEVKYQYLEPACGFEEGLLVVGSTISINLEHPNESSNTSNTLETSLLNANLCQTTDACIETVQLNPSATTVVNWEEEVTFETTVCNNGPLDVPFRFYLQNFTPNVANWTILSVNCIETTGALSCDDLNFTIQPTVWTSNDYIMPANSTITVQSVVVFHEPPCTSNSNNLMVNIRSNTNILSNTIFDTIFDENNFDDDTVILPIVEPCVNFADISITKTQVSPALPEGSTANNTTDWGEITYEITASNSGNSDAHIQLKDYTFNTISNSIIGTLVSFECTSTTGTATCLPIEHINIGVPFDGVPQNGMQDIFWEIVPEDNWILPANSSVTFTTVVNWEPLCSDENIVGSNHVTIENVNSNVGDDPSNNLDHVNTFFAPCVDLVVQTFPEFTSVSINQPFNWIIDITNSNTSSNAIDIFFEDTLNSVFNIAGAPTCQVTSGNASCIPSFNISNNSITGIIPNMDAGSTIRIKIPVTAPSFGGAFNNTAKAIPDTVNNHELTPETNISISNVQVLAPTLIKSFDPETIFVGQESTLTFTVYNLASNPSQNNITFTDNLPEGLSLSGDIVWNEANGCTATFAGSIGDDFISVTNLSFPLGVSSCTFSVSVTSSIVGEYVNNANNFSNQQNIDTSQTYAPLNVIEDTTNVDIEVVKNVFPEEVSLGDTVEFSIKITNLGTTTATQINIFESLPIAYHYISSSTTIGNYEVSSFLWNVASLEPNQTETLTITAQVISSINLLNTALLDSVNETDRNASNNEDSAMVVLDDCL